MIKNLRLMCLGAAALLATSAAPAAPIQLSASIAGSSHLEAGQHAGVFDGSSLLPAQFVIDAASFTFVFADDADSVTGGTPLGMGSSATAYVMMSSGYSSGDYYRSYLRTETEYLQVIREGEAESVNVLLGGMSVGKGETAMSSSTSVDTAYGGRSYDGASGYNGYSYSYRCGFFRTCGGYVPGSWSYYYTDHFAQTTVSTLDWSGGFEINGDLTDSPLLDQLLTTRQLPFEFDVTGDLVLLKATLTLDITEVQAVAVQAVPAPGSLVLAVSGLAGLWALRRRRTPL